MVFRLDGMYVDGLDRMAAFLNYTASGTPEKGNPFSIVLEVEGTPDESAVRELLERRLAPVLPLLHGHLSNHFWTWAPCWVKGKPSPVPFSAESPGDSPDAAVETFATEPLPGDARMAVKLFRGEPVSRLVFKFSHLLFDGRGGELVIDCLLSGAGDLAAVPPGYSHPLLNEWGKQFAGGKIVQHYGNTILAEGTTASLPGGSLGRTRFHRIFLQPEEYGNLTASAERLFGPFMLTPFLLGGILRRFNALLGRLGAEGESLVIPMSVDMRNTPDVPANPYFFNQWSMMPVKAARRDLAEFRNGVAALRTRIFRAIAAKLPHAYRVAPRLTRLVPFPLMARAFRKKGAASTGSMMFSYLDSALSAPGTLCGYPVRNLYHMPVMPPLNALGIFANSFNGRLNLIASFREGNLPEEEWNRFLSELENDLSALGKGMEL